MTHLKQISVFSFVGIFLLAFGGIAITFIPDIISMFVHKQMALVPQNPSFPFWKDLDIPISQTFYFFNITNAEDVEKHGAKPNLEQVGPFYFRMKLSKTVSFAKNNTRMFFRENRQYFFDESKSISSLDTRITTLNVPLAVAWQTIDFKKMNRFLVPVVKSILKSQSFFIRPTIDELIFKGAKNVISCIGHLIDPKTQPDCLFAYFPGQNNTDDGLYEINTGLNDPQFINSIVSLNGSSHLDVWEGEQCNKIPPATNGELFPTFDVISNENKTLQMFRSDFCRVFNLTLGERDIPSDIVDTLIVNRYRIPKNLFYNESMNKANECYKPKKKQLVFDRPIESLDFPRMLKMLKEDGDTFEEIEDAIFNPSVPDDDDTVEEKHDKDSKNRTKRSYGEYRERPSGVFDMSACKNGLPVFLSFPHFLNADPVYLHAVTGLNPDNHLYNSYINVEPITGTPVDFLARIQINIDVDTKLSGSKMKSLMFPTMWQEFSIHITETMANTIMNQTRTPKIIAFSVSSLLLAIGLAFVLYAILLIIFEFHHRRAQKDEEPLLTDQDNTDSINSIDNANNNSIIS